jgi:hypothetical protein
VLSDSYLNQISLVAPPNPTLMIVLIVAAVAAGGIAISYVIVKQVQKRRSESEQNRKESGTRKRRGEIFQGASSLGRASGDEAEVILAKRRQGKVAKGKGTGSEAPPKEGAPKKSAPLPPSAASIRETGPEEAKPKKEENFDTLDTRASAQQVRAVEKKIAIDVGKKVDFIEARITNIDNVVSMVADLVNRLPESIACDKCGEPLVEGWTECPWCIVKDREDELEMQMSIAGVDSGKGQTCPNCRATLHPSWAKCPYCATRNL